MFKLGSWWRPTAPAARLQDHHLVSWTRGTCQNCHLTRAHSKAFSPYPRATTLPSLWHGCRDIWQQGQLAVLVGRREYKCLRVGDCPHKLLLRTSGAHFQGWQEEGTVVVQLGMHRKKPLQHSPESLRTIDKQVRPKQNPSKIMSLTGTEN